jgi:glycosyltransferase involved in cell wall biosynthesis
MTEGSGKEASRVGGLSIVVPVMNEVESVKILHGEIVLALGHRPFEIIFVDDGSTDGTFGAIEDLHRSDPRVRAIKLRRNHGKSAAYAVGFEAARLPVVATLDGDLQDDPADIPKLLLVQERGTPLVVGWKRTGKSGPMTFLLSKLSNFLMRLLTGLKLHDMNCPMRVMNRDLARQLHLHSDLHRYIPLLAARMGYAVAEVPISNRKRRFGRSKYSYGKYLSGAAGLTSLLLYSRFGRRPMLLFLPLGGLCFLIGFVLEAVLAYGFFAGTRKIDDDLPTILLGVMLIVIGSQFIALGLLAEIVIRNIGSVEGRISTDVEREL